MAATPHRSCNLASKITSAHQIGEEEQSRVAEPREGEECESETLILGRDSAPRVRLLLDSQTGQHWSNGQSQQSTLIKIAKMVK